MTALQETDGKEVPFLATARKPDLSTSFLPWAYWKEKWKEADDASTCLGLLHGGFKTNAYVPEEEEERLRFFLLIAQGYGNRSLSHGDMLFSGKAFSVLADQLADILEQRLPLFSPEAVEAVLHFFRPRENNLVEGGGLQNFPRMPDADDKSRHYPLWKMAEVCRAWCRLMWDTASYGEDCRPGGHWPKNEATLAALKAARPKILEILYAFKRGELERLLDPQMAFENDDVNRPVIRVRWEIFTADCLKKLEELALRSGPTLPWAVTAGSSAARVLLVVRAAHAFQKKHQTAKTQ